MREGWRDGWIDSVTASGISGWAHVAGELPELTVYVNGEAAAVQRNVVHRPDLQEIGLNPNLGFFISVAPTLQTDDIVEVLYDDQQHLNNSPWRMGEALFVNSAERQRLATRGRSCPIFLHIPKTAGSSFRSFVNDNILNSLKLYDKKHLDGQFINEFRNNELPSLILGHLNFGVHLHLGLVPDYMTILRNPVDRIVSLFRYNKQISHSNFEDRHLSSMQAFLESRMHCDQTNNPMCRMLSGLALDPQEYIDENWLVEIVKYNFRKYFSLVGTTDNFASFVGEFSKIMGCSDGYDGRWVNKTQGARLEIDAETEGTIKIMNRLDFILYNFVASQCNLNEGVWRPRDDQT